MGEAIGSVVGHARAYYLLEEHCGFRRDYYHRNVRRVIRTHKPQEVSL